MFQGSEDTGVLNMPELHKVWNMPEYVWIIPEYAWFCLNMSKYAGICVNIPKSAWLALVLHVLIVIPCLLERAVPNFNYSLKKQENEKYVSCDYASTKFNLKEHEAVFLKRQKKIL